MTIVVLGPGRYPRITGVKPPEECFENVMPRRRETESFWRPPIFGPEEWHELIACCGLSPRQSQIVGLVMQSRQDKEIIAALKISHSTCRTHLCEAKARLEARDRVGLAYRLFWNFRQSIEQKCYPWPPRDPESCITRRQ